MRHKIVVVTLVMLAVACTEGTISSLGQTGLNITGNYTLAGDASATLEVKREETHYVALLSGGSLEVAGAAAGADCYVSAIGTLRENRLVGSFAAIETDTFLYSETQAQEEERRLEIKFGSDTAEVIHADTFGYCGLGVTFLGRYERNRDSPP